MIFGLPWFAIIPIVAIIGGFLYAYKEQELKLEEKRLASSREINEMRKIIHNLTARVEQLENKTKQAKTGTAGADDALNRIEINDGPEVQNDENPRSGRPASSIKN